MKTNYSIANSPELNSFEPVEGKWNTELEDWFDAQEEIAADLEAKHGFKVKVELFQDNGHAITSECSYGTLLATRA